jgi:hypothetical protein
MTHRPSCTPEDFDEAMTRLYGPLPPLPPPVQWRVPAQRAAFLEAYTSMPIEIYMRHLDDTAPCWHSKGSPYWNVVLSDPELGQEICRARRQRG